MVMFMTVSWSDYLAYITESVREPIYKIELLRLEDESVYQTIADDVVNNSGNLTISYNQGVRRTVNFNLININKQHISMINNLQIGSKFALHLGYRINDEDYYRPKGVFVFDDPTLISNLSERSIQISGTDKFSILNGQNGGILEATYKADVGDNFADIIRSLLSLEIVNDPKDPIIDPSFESLTIPYTITHDPGSTVANIIFELCFAISANVYYNANGNLVIEPIIPDEQKGSVYDFSLEEYNYLGSSKKYLLSEIYNATLVIGENTQTTTPIIYEANNNDPTDNNSIPNLGRKKIKIITQYTEGITSEELAKQRAEWELKNIIGKLSAVDINTIPLYHLEEDQAITLTDEYIDSNREKFIILNINLPIGTSGEASLSVRKVVDV